MPMYSYRLKSGRVVERHFQMGKAPQKIKVDGKTALRDFISDHAGKKIRHGEIWPMFSYAAGVRPWQREKFAKILREKGVRDVEFNARGHIKMNSRSHRNQILRALNMMDNDAGYGDYSGR